MVYKKYLISYTYVNCNNLYEGLLPLPIEYYRTESINKTELEQLVIGIKLGLGDRLKSNIVITEIK